MNMAGCRREMLRQTIQTNCPTQLNPEGVNDKINIQDARVYIFTMSINVHNAFVDTVCRKISSDCMQSNQADLMHRLRCKESH